MCYEITSREAVSPFVNWSCIFKRMFRISTSNRLSLVVRQSSASADKKEMGVSPILISSLFFEVGKVRIRHSSRKLSLLQDVTLVIWGGGGGAQLGVGTYCAFGVETFRKASRWQPWQVVPMTFTPSICKNVAVLVILAKFVDNEVLWIKFPLNLFWRNTFHLLF